MRISDPTYGLDNVPSSGKKLLLRLCAAALLALSILALSACSETAQERNTLRVGHTLDINHPVHKALEFMAKDLADRSSGKMTLKIYSSGQLGSEREMIELLQVGVLDMTKVSASPLEGFAPQMGVFGLPYLFRDNDHYWQVLNSDIGSELLQSLEPKRLVGLGYFDAGSRSFYTKSAPVDRPEDIAGQKVRVMNSQMAIATMDALGAAATPLDGGEVYTALQQGLVDAAENNPPTYLSSRHYEVAPYFSLDEHSSIPDVILLSSARAERLSPQQMEWLQASMRAASAYQRRLWANATDEALAELESKGVTISRPEKAPFQSDVAALYRDMENADVAALARRISELSELDMEDQP